MDSTDSSSNLDTTHKYLVLPFNTKDAGTFLFRPIQSADIEQIRRWRNSQKNVLRQSKDIQPSEQELYYTRTLLPEYGKKEPNQILMSIFESGNLLGYGGLVHISWPDRRAEISFLLDPIHEGDSDYKSIIFSTFLEVVGSVAFQDLGLQKLWTETFAFRTGHLEILEKKGFSSEGRLRKHWYINGEFIDSLLHGLHLDQWRGRDR